MINLPKKLCFVDVETTGCGTYDRIIEIGIVKVENNKVVETFQTLLNPNCYIPKEILEMTGISSIELENSPTFGQVKQDILKILEDCVFVAHNVRFDYSFIKNEFKRENISFSSKHFCTVKLSKHLYPSFIRHNLDELIQRFNFKCEKRHRAFDDAKVLWDFYQIIQEEFGEDEIKRAVNFVLKKPSRPINIPEEALDNLPESPGVYIFYGKNGAPLYVGKSINIRERVLSHFASDYASTTEMKIAQQIESIETIVTSGELGALFKEATLIKKMQPLYNRRLRYSRKITVLKSRMDKDGYLEVEFETADKLTTTDIDNILGIFRSVKKAKDLLIYLAKEHNLCEKLLSLEKCKDACFGYRLGRCKGACKNSEKPIVYNTRFLEAFSDTLIRPWPYTKPIIIEEKDDVLGKGEVFLFDKWCYLGSIEYNDQGEQSYLEKNITFDMDTYKILNRFLRNNSFKKKIKQINQLEKFLIPFKDQDTFV